MLLLLNKNEDNIVYMPSIKFLENGWDKIKQIDYSDKFFNIDIKQGITGVFSKSNNGVTWVDHKTGVSRTVEPTKNKGFEL